MKQTLNKPVDECTLEGLAKKGFEGTDASLEISLGEYGLACTYNEEDDDWFCIVEYKKDRDGNYETFYTGYVEESEIHEIARDQGGAGFYNFIGAAPWVWRRSDVIRKIQDVKDYLGPENVFGSPGSAGEVFQLMALEEV